MPSLLLIFLSVTTKWCFIFITLVLECFRVIIIQLFPFIFWYAYIDSLGFFLVLILCTYKERFCCIRQFYFCLQLHGSSWLLVEILFSLLLLIIWEKIFVELYLTLTELRDWIHQPKWCWVIQRWWFYCSKELKFPTNI